MLYLKGVPGKLIKPSNCNGVFHIKSGFNIGKPISSIAKINKYFWIVFLFAWLFILYVLCAI